MIAFASPEKLWLILLLIPFLAILRLAHVRQQRAASALGLPRPSRAAEAADLLLPSLIALLLVGAAAAPEVARDSKLRKRTDVDIWLTVDLSKSMLARQSKDSPTRAERAAQIAQELTLALPGELPLGLAAMPRYVLPILGPDADRRSVRSSIDSVLKVGKLPAGGAFSADASNVSTDFTNLSAFPYSRLFLYSIPKRVVILVTDAEGPPFANAAFGSALTGGFKKARVKLFVIRVGGKNEQIWLPNGQIDPNFTHLLGSVDDLKDLARVSGGGFYEERDVGKVADAVKNAVGDGPTRLTDQNLPRYNIAPYLACAALVLLGLLVGRRASLRVR